MNDASSSLTAAPQSPAVEPSLAALAATTFQMATASAYVLGERGQMLAQAAFNPWQADHVEFGLMVPEKLAAFSSATNALVIGWAQAHQAAVAHIAATFLAAAACGSRPTSGGIMDFLEKTNRYSANSFAEGLRTASEMLSPIHQSATANAQRLAAAKSSRS